LSVSVKEVSEVRRAYWDKELSKFELVHPFNAYGWGKVRAADGWASTYLIAERGDSVIGAVMLLTKSIPLTGGLSIMYAPRGPVCEFQDKETLRALLDAILVKAQQNRSIFLRISPNITEERLGNDGKDPFLEAGFIHLKNRWSNWNAPCDVYRTDLSKAANEQQLFARINPKARNGIRRAKKDGVAIQQGITLKELRSFYNVFQKFTVERGFMLRGFEYQKRLFSEYIANSSGVLFLSTYKGSVVGGQICLRLGALCVEMHRCVDDQYRKHRINEALVWEGMKWAKKKGCSWYCQRGYGSPGLAEFKQKFDAKLVHLAGYYDLPLRHTLYSCFTFLEFKLLPILLPLFPKRFKGLLSSSVLSRIAHYRWSRNPLP
jgi:peptidoglycan pentaglycine glycine transferase (the first glycine)